MTHKQRNPPAIQPLAADLPLLDAIVELSTARDLPSLLRIIPRATRVASGADGATVVLREGRRCHYVDEDAIGPLWKGQRFPLEACISGWVMQQGQTVALPDVFADARVPHDAYRPTFVKSLAMVPVGKEAALGAYWATHHVVTPSEVAGLAAVSRATGCALEHIRAHAAQTEALRSAEARLAGQDVLLREVHHRVKNDLQMLVDVLFLGEQRVENDEAKAALRDASARIHAVARVHEHLYRARSGKDVELAEYLRGLVEAIVAVEPRVRLTFRDETHNVAFGLEVTIHLGLIVNELVTNAVKHAFPPGATGEVRVALRVVGPHIEVQVSDTGIGLPQALDPARTSSLGLRIVYILAKGLGASLKIASTNGACFTITFPVPAPR